MSRSSLSAAFPRFATRLGVVAASTAVAGLVVLTTPVHAQLIGSVGQRSPVGPGVPPSAAPVRVFSSIPSGNYSQQRQAYPQQRQAYPQRQPVYPQASWGGQPGYPSSPYGSFYQRGPVGGLQQGYVPPSQQTVTPGIIARYGSMGTENPLPERRYTNNGGMPAGVISGRRSFPPTGIRVNGGAPIGDMGRGFPIATSGGARLLPPRQYNNYIYAPTTIVDGPSLLGGYYYGNYCDTYSADAYCYPSVYSSYPGMPEYIINPGVIVLGSPYYPNYATPYLPFSAPTYQVTFNQANYYVASPDRVQQIQDGGPTARRALQNAYAEGSYQAAFGDIEKAWQSGDIALLRTHIRDSDTKMSVYFKGKYSYSIASGDFVQITRDAFDRLSTVSFEFTRLRKAKNGDVTAYGKHVYQSGGSSDASGDASATGDTVPFSTDGSQPTDGTQPYDRTEDPAAGQQKIIYMSYTLRKHDDQWYIIGVDSSPTELAK